MSGHTTVAILQARASSRRLAAKVIQPILGQPMLARQIERVRRAKLFSELVLATSALEEDDPVAAIGESCGIAVYRGSLDDVLDRFYQAAEPRSPEHVVRLTGDCPLADWELIDRVIQFAVDGGYDYASNTLRPTWPDGLDVEVVRFEVLAEAWREAESPFDREHVLPFVHRQPDRYRLGNLENTEDLSAMRWTVDEARDLDMVTAVYQSLYPRNPAFTTAEILQFLIDNPHIAAGNEGIERNEGSKLK